MARSVIASLGKLQLAQNQLIWVVRKDGVHFGIMSIVGHLRHHYPDAGFPWKWPSRRVHTDFRGVQRYFRQNDLPRAGCVLCSTPSMMTFGEKGQRSSSKGPRCCGMDVAQVGFSLFQIKITSIKKGFSRSSPHRSVSSSATSFLAMKIIPNGSA